MTHFVKKSSIVRRIWGSSDVILFIFAGAAAEFALNKAVDWLYYTGKLPQDPLGRLFSTVGYAKRIVFASEHEAHRAIDHMTQIHASLEKGRGRAIPDWAYRDVLFMLIYYSIAAYELLEQKLNDAEKEEVYNVFFRVGQRMGLKDLPQSYVEWLPVREAHLVADLSRSALTDDLFKQYRKHLGRPRYILLREAQKLVVPGQVGKLLGYGPPKWLKPSVPLYKFSQTLHLESIIKSLLLPREYQKEIKALDVV